MNTNKLKFTPLQNKIFRLLCIKSGKKLNQREIARNLKATPPGIAKSLPYLEKKQLIKVEKNQVMNLNLITLDRNQKTLRLKQLENLEQIYDADLIELLEEKYPGTTIILFGSYAKGEDTLNSDIDLAIIGTRAKSINLEKFEKMLERNININFYDDMKTIHKEFRENLCNGIVLSGGVEL